MADSIGALHERVTIQILTETSDGGGGAAQSFSDVATVWARVQPISTSSDLRASAQSLLQRLKVTIRYRSDMAAVDSNRYQLLWNGNLLRLLGRPENLDERKRYLSLTCEMGQAEAT